MQKSERTSRSGSFLPPRSLDRSQVIGLGAKCLYPLSYFSDPVSFGGQSFTILFSPASNVSSACFSLTYGSHYIHYNRKYSIHTHSHRARGVQAITCLLNTAEGPPFHLTGRKVSINPIQLRNQQTTIMTGAGGHAHWCDSGTNSAGVNNHFLTRCQSHSTSSNLPEHHYGAKSIMGHRL